LIIDNYIFLNLYYHIVYIIYDHIVYIICIIY